MMSHTMLGAGGGGGYSDGQRVAGDRESAAEVEGSCPQPLHLLLISAGLQSRHDQVRDLDHLPFSHAAGGHGRSPEPHTARLLLWKRIVREEILVDGYPYR